MMATDFWDKVALLVLGAILTGLLVPIVKASLDSSSARRQQVLATQLSRKAEVVASQIKLLADFSDQAWQFVFGALKVSYAYAWEGPAEQAAAAKTYTPMSWELASSLRATISKGSRLLDEATVVRLMGTYRWLLRLDDRLSVRLSGQALTSAEWVEFHVTNFDEAAKEIDSAITVLAGQLRLSVEGSVQTHPAGHSS